MEPIDIPLDPLNDPSLTEKQKERIIWIRAKRAAERKAERAAERALDTALPIPMPKASAKALVTSLSKDIIMSVAIFGHGCEDFDRPLTDDLADYYRNNVRVYSRACVPGIISVGNILENEDIIRAVRGSFSRTEFVGGTEFVHGTDYVINKYIEDTKPKYLDRVRGFHDKTDTSAKAAETHHD